MIMKSSRAISRTNWLKIADVSGTIFVSIILSDDIYREDGERDGPRNVGGTSDGPKLSHRVSFASHIR
jgi:hypothetical protein